MSSERTPPPTSAQTPSSADNGTLDDGRRYWKAAIAHLAPEKREAAWEFYLDRLESSAAADTLGGVMLLLEAHLAFFDDLPARLGAAAQQIEAAIRPLDRVGALPAPSSSADMMEQGTSVPRNCTKRRSPFFIGIAVVVSAIFGCACTIAYQRWGSAGGSTNHSTPTQNATLPQIHSIKVEPWNDPVTGRYKGSIVCFSHAATTERTSEGGARIYVQTPVEEVRENIGALRQLAR